MKTIQIEISNPGSQPFTIASAIEILIAEALSHFRKSGYTLSIRREAAGLYCAELDQWIMPKAFTVDQFCYFRGLANPDADRIVYAISLLQGAKGYLVDASVAYSEIIVPEKIKKSMPYPQNIL